MLHELFLVRPLVDRLVGDDSFSPLLFELPRDHFRGPSFQKLRAHVGLQLFILHRIPPVGVPLLHAGAQMSTIGIVSFYGTIRTAASDLHAETAHRARKLLCDLSQAQAFSKEDCKNTALLLGEMTIGMHRTRRVEDYPGCSASLLNSGVVIAHELVEAVKSNVTIDWTMKEGVRAKMRTIVKRLLRKYGYPPDLQEKATQIVLEQAEVIAKDWAA